MLCDNPDIAIKAIAELLGEGYDIDKEADDGDTLLHKAASMFSLEVVEYLLEKGANPNALNHEGKTPLMLLFEEYEAESLDEEYKPIAIALVKAGANLDIRDNDERSVLDIVTEPEVKVFIKKGLVDVAKARYLAISKIIPPVLSWETRSAAVADKGREEATNSRIEEWGKNVSGAPQEDEINEGRKETVNSRIEKWGKDVSGVPEEVIERPKALIKPIVSAASSLDAKRKETDRDTI